jgi:replicative superfamily II helicase
MLLSPPFLNDGAQQLVDWLSGSQEGTSIKVDWKPSEKIIMGLQMKKYKPDNFEAILLPSPYNHKNLKEEITVQLNGEYALNSKRNRTNKTRLLEYSAHHFSRNSKTILYLCWGPGSADNRAEELLRIVGDNRATEKREIVAKYIEDEIGERTVLSECIRQGIATHHAGMTEDAKALVEYLIREGEVQHICATTTIAQGVNFLFHQYLLMT